MQHGLWAMSAFGEAALVWIEAASLAIEILAVVIITAATFFALGRYLYRILLRAEGNWSHELKHSLARSLLVGLEVLVAADVVRTVVLDLTFESVGVLGLLVLIRTFLGWALIVEMEGRWPWQGNHAQPGVHSPHQHTDPNTSVHSGELQ